MHTSSKEVKPLKVFVKQAIQKGNEKLRYGYTTGACAAAAAKAAALALRDQEPTTEVALLLPGGQEARFMIEFCEFDSFWAKASVVKDAGDDPDITHGARIEACVELSSSPGCTLKGGEGVGIITKPGLELRVGTAAINPVPREMIVSAVQKVFAAEEDKGLTITVSIPQGRELAKRTLNQRLGIEGGLSILGTTGQVIPYSKEAYTASIATALKIACALDCKEVVFSTGRRSEKFAQQEFDYPEEAFIQVADFVGFALDEAARCGFEKVILWGMIGKLSKIAAGVFYTHSEASSIDIRFLIEVAREGGIEESKLQSLRGTRTAHQFLRRLSEGEQSRVITILCTRAARQAYQKVGGLLKTEVVLSNYQGEVQGRSGA